jgi:hypothetical protein
MEPHPARAAAAAIRHGANQARRPHPQAGRDRRHLAPPVRELADRSYGAISRDKCFNDFAIALMSVLLKKAPK